MDWPSARAFLAAAILAPIALAFVHRDLGHHADIEFFHAWYLSVRESAAFYADGPGINYPIVGVLLVSGPACAVDALVGHPLDLSDYRLVLKGTLVVGEIGFVLVSERLARALGEARPRLLALFVYALPSTWAGGAWFGQTDVWGTVLLLAAALHAVRFRADGRSRSLVLALIALMAAMLSKQLTWFAVPALGVLILLGLARHGTPARWGLALAAPLLLVAADPFLSLPGDHASHLWLVLSERSTHGDVVIASGASLWSLVAAGGTPASSIAWLGLDSRAWGWALFLVALVVIVRAIWRRPDDRALVMAAGLTQLAMATLLTGVHERYLTHAIPLLFLGRGASLPGASISLGIAVSVSSAAFVLSTLATTEIWALSRPQPVALLSLAWGIAILVELARRPRAPFAPETVPRRATGSKVSEP